MATLAARVLHTINLRPAAMSSLLFLKPPPPPYFYSTTATPYPLQYDLIVARPAHQQTPRFARRRRRRAKPEEEDRPESDSDSIGFDDWVDKKLSSAEITGMDKSMRKYYNKRTKRMYGEESDEESRRKDNDGFVELKQDVVELRTLHKREEELYFYDAFAYPWEKDKHYKMVYQMEKKYFPDQGFDKAFLESKTEEKKQKQKQKKEENVSEDDRKMVFFDDGDSEEQKEGSVGVGGVGGVSEKKVEEFFKCLKKVPNKDGVVVANKSNAEPFLSSRSRGLPPQWDTPGGTVVLINKPKG